MNGPSYVFEVTNVALPELGNKSSDVSKKSCDDTKKYTLSDFDSILATWRNPSDLKSILEAPKGVQRLCATQMGDSNLDLLCARMMKDAELKKRPQLYEFFLSFRETTEYAARKKEEGFTHRVSLHSSDGTKLYLFRVQRVVTLWRYYIVPDLVETYYRADYYEFEKEKPVSSGHRV